MKLLETPEMENSSEKEVAFNDKLEVLPGFSHYDPVTAIKRFFISPFDHTRQNLCLQTMESSGFKFVHLRKVIESEWDSPESVQASTSDYVQSII